MIAKKAIVVLISLAAGLATSALVYLAKIDAQYTDKVYPHVYIDQVAFGGMTKPDIVAYFTNKNRVLGRINITVLFRDEKIATFSGSDVGITYNGQAMADRTFLVGRSPNWYSAIGQKIQSLLGRERYDFSSTVEYHWPAFQEFLNNSEEKYNQPAKNALFQFENGKVTSFRKEENGQVLLADDFHKDLDKAIRELKNRPQNITITLQTKPVVPEVTLAKANNYGIEELVAVGKSDYSHSIPGRIHNIILAASKFNGVLIPKEAAFSFNDTVGDISSTTGYEQAYIIKEGKTVLGDGGGVCQVSTTLFRAALNAGLPIIQRFAHAYRVGYYENDAKPGLDATVFAPSVDLKIKNDTPGYLLIETEVDKDNNILIFKFYGKKDGRRVEIGTPVLYDVVPPLPDVNQDDPTMKKGEVKQVDFAAWGGKANFTYKVYKDGKLSIDTNFLSIFKPWANVYLRGTAD